MTPSSSRLRVAAAVVAATLAATGLASCGAGDGEGEQAVGTAAVEQQPVLEPWYAAARSSADQPATAVVLGDSVSEGFGLTGRLERRWLDRLQAGLRSRLTPDCPTGPAGWHGTSSLVPADYRASSLPDPVRSGRTRNVYEQGPGGRALALEPGASLTWVLDARQVVVGYRTAPGGGALRVEIDRVTGDAGHATTARVVTTPRERPARETWASGDLGGGPHRVRVSNASPPGGGPVVVTDVRPYRDDRDRCVHVLDAARSGVSLRFIVEHPDYLADVLSLDPDLLVVPLGFNDARAGQRPADYGESLQRLVRQVRRRGYDGPVLVVGLFHPGPAGFRDGWSGYLEVMHETAATEEGVSYIDLSRVLPHVDRAPEGTYIDTLHPGPAGMRLIADALLEALTPRQTPDRPDPAPST